MLGQLGFEQPQPNEKLRNRISLFIIPNAEGNKIVKKYHYLHRARTGGQQLTYGILFDGKLVGVLVYTSPTFRKKKGLIPPLINGEVIELARVWLSDEAPKHSETCSLGKSLRRIRDDWLRKYGQFIKAVISFSDLEFGHKGVIYKAANFNDCGFVPSARLADARNRYSRANKGRGSRHYTKQSQHHSAPRTANTNRVWLYFFGQDIREVKVADVLLRHREATGC